MHPYEGNENLRNRFRSPLILSVFLTLSRVFEEITFPSMPAPYLEMRIFVISCPGKDH